MTITSIHTPVWANTPTGVARLMMSPKGTFYWDIRPEFLFDNADDAISHMRANGVKDIHVNLPEKPRRR